MSILSFFRKSAPAPRLPKDDDAMMRLYKKLRWQSFIAGTVGYSLYYVCRTSLNVVKKPILESGALDATQLGVIGSALLFAYAIGKFVNGFLSDHSNIKRFMATGLIVSAAANMLMGVLGLMHSVIPTAVIFIAFAVMWGLNGWSQSMGAAPAIISLSRWYPLKERGTYYGFFSASHNLGEFFSFLFVDIFDTLGTLIGVCNKGNMLDKDGKLPQIKPALMADAIATSAGAILGTSTTTTFVESSAGVAEGGRTGLTAVVTAVLFLISMLFAPIFIAIPSFATAPALIVVGFYMIGSVSEIDFNDPAEGIPAFLCIIAMPFFYSISEGISMGVIAYVVMNLFAGKKEKITPVMYILAVLFILKYILM